MSSFPNYMPPPRLCILRKWPTYAGYGFNLHAEKGKAGQYIGKVDPDSPAELGGLKPKDFLIEVNETNVEDLTHQKVVERVKEVPDMVKMLVIEMDTYKFCKENGIVISCDMPEVVVYTTPDTQPKSKSGSLQHEVDHEPALEVEHQLHQESAITADSTINEVEEEDVPDSEPEPTEQPHQPQAQQYQDRIEAHSAVQAHSQPPPQPQGSPGANGSGGSNPPAVKDPVGNISLEEMRAKIGSNRRNQAKMNPSSFSEKYNMFQAL